MQSTSGRTRAVRIAVLLALAACVSACGQFRAHEVEAYVREAGGISVDNPSIEPGEALIRITNDSREPARIVLARLEPEVGDVAALPLRSDGTVDVGTDADIVYDGPGYRVLSKIDDLSPHFARMHTEGTIHVHLPPGRYVLFSNLPGDFAAGRWAQLDVG